METDFHLTYYAYTSNVVSINKTFSYLGFDFINILESERKNSSTDFDL